MKTKGCIIPTSEVSVRGPTTTRIPMVGFNHAGCIRRLFSALCAAAFCFSQVQAAPADSNVSGARLTIELWDGSRVIGKSVEDTLAFHSAMLGDINLPWSGIRSIEYAATNTGMAQLTATNGDRYQVQFAASSVRVQTIFGNPELPVKLIRSIQVSTAAYPTQLPPGLVALWSGEDNGNDSISGNTAALTDITFAEGKVGRAFSFNGISSSIKIPASKAVDLGADEGFTIMAWIKPLDVDGMHPLFEWTDFNGLNLEINARPSDSGGLWASITDQAGNRFCNTHIGLLATGVFQHIACTYDRDSSMATWYLNGVVVARLHLSGNVAGTKGDLIISRRNTRPGDWSSNRSYSGLMDEIALYNRALSASEVLDICTAQNRGEPPVAPAPSTGWFEPWMQ